MNAPALSLFRLVYISRQTADTAARLDAAVDSIITKAIDINSRAGVTGLLIAAKGLFVQALEGPRDAVHRIYSRIATDPRHVGARIISAGPADARLFAEWFMCAGALGAVDKAILGVIDKKESFEKSLMMSDNALRLLTVVAGIQRRTAEEAARRIG